MPVSRVWWYPQVKSWERYALSGPHGSCAFDLNKKNSKRLLILLVKFLLETKFAGFISFCVQQHHFIGYLRSLKSVRPHSTLICAQEVRTTICQFLFALHDSVKPLCNAQDSSEHNNERFSCEFRPLQ
jgi:hypothetical protein